MRALGFASLLMSGVSWSCRFAHMFPKSFPESGVNGRSIWLIDPVKFPARYGIALENPILTRFLQEPINLTLWESDKDISTRRKSSYNQPTSRIQSYAVGVKNPKKSQ